MQEQIADSVESEPDREAMREALDSAIERLPEKYRLPLVLFHLEGCPLAEVAARLRLNEGTAGSRISRAREKLRSVLVRRGVAVGSVAMLTSLLSAEAEAAGLSASFTATTAHAAVAVAGKAGLAGAVGVVSPQVVGLTEGAAKMIMISGIKSAAVVFTAGSLVVGTGVVTAQQVVTRASAAVEQSTEDHETELRKELLTVVKMGREGESTKAAGLLPGLYERAKAEDLKAEILYWQGWMHNEAGDRDAASRVLRQVVVIDPEGKWAKYAQGKLHTIVNQLDQIAKDEKAVRTSSSSTISLFGQSTNVVESADGKLRATITLSPAPASEE
jgi:hypothetical protein